MSHRRVHLGQGLLAQPCHEAAARLGGQEGVEAAMRLLPTVREPSRLYHRPLQGGAATEAGRRCGEEGRTHIKGPSTTRPPALTGCPHPVHQPGSLEPLQSPRSSKVQHCPCAVCPCGQGLVGIPSQIPPGLQWTHQTMGRGLAGDAQPALLTTPNSNVHATSHAGGHHPAPGREGNHLGTTLRAKAAPGPPSEL